jgi:hypothetical protein
MTAKALPLVLAIGAAVSLFAPASAVAQGAGAPPPTGPRVEMMQAFRVVSPSGDSGATLQAVGRKDPLVAGILSFFVPGLGSFYAGNSGHGIRHLGIAVAGAVLYVSGTDCTASGTGYGTSCSYSTAAQVGLGVILVDWIWATVVAVNDANAHNRRAGGAHPAGVAGRLDVAPSIVGLSNGVASSRALRPVESAGLQLVRVEF